MSPTLLVFLLVACVPVRTTVATTDPSDFTALSALQDVWENFPPDWTGTDPCGSRWVGIFCSNSRVVHITLASVGLKGPLTSDITFLTELQILDLSYNNELSGTLPSSIGNLKKLTNLILVGCGFSGRIPASIGSLPELISLSLNNNGFSGPIPPEIGNLSKLFWLDLANNSLTGPIPVSTETTPGLDMLVHTKHFHFGLNQLSGRIPSKLFSSNMVLIHLLFERNKLEGSIPSTIALVQSLEVIRLDGNLLTGPVPSNLNNLTNTSELFLSNNGFSGPIPNLTGMGILQYLDMSNNSFSATDFPPWLTTLQSLTTINMEGTQLGGQVPAGLFSLPFLQSVVLRNNQLNGTLNIGTRFGPQLQLIDFQHNLISAFTQSPATSKIDVVLTDNPVCQETTGVTPSYCTDSRLNSSYATPQHDCEPVSCLPDQISSPHCRCSYPYSGILTFRATSFSNLGNSSLFESLETSIISFFNNKTLPVDSISLSYPRRDSNEYLKLDLDVFPSGQDSFNRTAIASIAFAMSNQVYKPAKLFGPFVFNANPYQHFGGESKGSSKSSSTIIIIGAVAGGAILVSLVLIASCYAYRQKKRAERATGQNNPFANWDSTSSAGGVPQLKGARCFSFEDVKKYTNNFSEANDVGSGGYGKVYRGTLPTGQVIAIKRAQQGSLQGGLEFKTEIELLSRVHHKNVVSLLGFCFDRGEQMLIYEFVPNGTLLESLSGKTGIKLDWMRRLRVALGAARGLAYLHELANPPIIHRDIKSTNILLDERLNAKVADFGLSKLMVDSEMGHVTHITTQVKGTMGYMDPEYYMTQQLTEKSDVYSFGVVMLELLTGRRPIERGKYIVREIRMAMDRTKELYNLHEFVDQNIGLDTTLKGLAKFVDLAMKCVQESGADRPTMGEVVKEIENILQLAGLNPNAESASTSESYDEASKGSRHPYNDEAFDYSGAFPPSKIEPL